MNRGTKLAPVHKVFSVLIMGYPKPEYLRTVDRKPMEARWELDVDSLLSARKNTNLIIRGLKERRRIWHTER
jgi:hypothetical protein